MAEIKPLNEIAEKWTRVTPGRAQDFQTGVQRPRRDWEQATGQAQSRWEEGVQQAIQQGRFAQGVQQAGTQKWARKVQEVGVQRWGPGVRAAVQDYQRGFEPFARTIEATQLPPRFPAGDPRNFDRVRVIGEALHRRKIQGGGG